jgi:phosphoglycerate dehydrogenase-like enzyme
MINVVATPHTAAFTDLGTRGMHDGVVDQILQLRDGIRPRHLVNPEAWPGRMAGPATG